MSDQQLAIQNPNASVYDKYTDEQINVIRNTLAPGASDTEFVYFLAVAEKRGLDVLAKQIHFVKRWQMGKEVGTIQTGIDGFRLIADRTGRYAPGPEPTFTFTEDGKLTAATAHVKKKVGGDWFDVAATAFYDEYIQTTKEGKPMGVWGKMPRNQLAKCAEALALRKAFPESLSGMYADEEMEQADSAPMDVSEQSSVKTAEVTQAMLDAYEDKLKEAEALGIARVELPADCTKSKWNAYMRSLTAAVDKKKVPAAAPPEVTEGEVIDPTDANVPPTEEPAKKKPSANFIAFTNKCKELNLDFKSEARLPAMNAWLKKRDYAEVTTSKDVPSGILYLMTADLGTEELTW